MLLKINSFNSKVFISGEYIDVSPEVARMTIEKAQNIDIELSFDRFKTKLECNLQCTSVSLFNPVVLQLTVSSRRAILQQGEGSFFPNRTIIFRPL